jgi:hypothetical protein
LRRKFAIVKCVSWINFYISKPGVKSGHILAGEGALVQSASWLLRWIFWVFNDYIKFLYLWMWRIGLYCAKVSLHPPQLIQLLWPGVVNAMKFFLCWGGGLWKQKYCKK